MTDPAPDAPAPAASPEGGAPGLFRFSIEGRHAPALFVAGWLATIVGSGLAVVGFLSAPGVATAILLVVGFALLSIGLVLLGGSQAIERRAGGEPYAGPSPVLVFLTIVVVTLLVAGVVGTLLEGLGLRPERAVGDLVSVALQAVVFVGVVALMVVSPGAITWAEMGLRRPPREVVVALLTGAAFALPVVILTGLLAAVLVPLIGQPPPSPLPPTGTATGLGLHLIAGAGIAPFAEEVVFRGVALTAWRRTAGPGSAILRSAVLFAAAHAIGIEGGSFNQAFGLAVIATVARLPVAVALGWVYARTGTLWASIGLHAAFNGLLIVVSEIGVSGPVALLLG